MCIIESVRNWSHLLIRQRFTFITDQKSVAFMLDNRKRTKIKNNKILGWRLDLAPFSYSIQYRPGVANVGPDTLTRAFCAATSSSNGLMDTHRGLGCPGTLEIYIKSFHWLCGLNELAHWWGKKFGFSSAHVVHDRQTCLTSSKEKGRFFCLTK